MAYIIEDNFDFFQALNVPDNVPQVENTCLITHVPLTYNHVELPCGHKFNYQPLYTELCLNMRKSKNLVCPYCRTISAKLMPYIPLEGVVRVSGVNSPDSKCLPGPTCSWLGKAICGKKCVEYSYGMYCGKHCIDEAVITDEWTLEMEVLQKYKSVTDLKEMLKNLGLKCGGTKKELIKRFVSNII